MTRRIDVETIVVIIQGTVATVGMFYAGYRCWRDYSRASHE